MGHLTAKDFTFVGEMARPSSAKSYLDALIKMIWYDKMERLSC